MSALHMQKVESAAITAIGYDEPSRTLHIEFKGGGRYTYHGVPPEAHAALMAADSKGGHINAHIKGTYKFQKQPAPRKKAA